MSTPPRLLNPAPHGRSGAMGSPACPAGDGAVRKLSRTSQQPLDQCRSNGLAGILPNPDLDHRTKIERLATILLPNPVAAHDTNRNVMDGHAKIFKEDKNVQNRPSLPEIAITEFRVRCSDPFRWTLP